MYAIRRHRAAIKAWCWRVRFSRRGIMYSKTFYELACGGSKQAKAQAIAWRDGQLAELKALTLLDFHKQKRSNNVSGVPGVHFHKTSRQPLGFWQAKIRFHDGKSVAKSFSVLKFGDRAAFHLAVAARSELLENVESRPYQSQGLKSDGSFWLLGASWGSSSGLRCSALHQVAEGKTFAVLAPGLSHAFGIQSDGTLWGWGWNSHGQLQRETALSKMDERRGLDWPAGAGRSILFICRQHTTPVGTSRQVSGWCLYGWQPGTGRRLMDGP